MLIDVEVAYAKADEQVIIPLSLGEDATLDQAIKVSGILQHFPEIDLSKNKLGIFSKVCKPGQKLKAGDRVEIYRPLLQSPMQARRNRASGK